MIGLVYGLNLLLIPTYGMTGAAISTAIALIAYNVGRVLFVYFAYKMHPFEINQLKVIVLFFGLILGIEYFVPTIENFFFSVGLKTLLFSLLFLTPIYSLNWNTDIKKYIQNGSKFLKIKLIKNSKF
jgi:O-antigen/teichoic acid export membrane protein